MCEKQGYIEKYYIDKPKDKVDETINDMKRYTHSLISGESDLITMIENAIKQNMREDEAALAADEEDIVDDDNISIDQIEEELKDSDILDFNDFIYDDMGEDLEAEEDA